MHTPATMPDSIISFSLIVFIVMMCGLFVWLFYDTRKEAREREKRGNERELQMLGALSTYSVQLPAIAKSLESIERRLELIGGRLHNES